MDRIFEMLNKEILNDSGDASLSLEKLMKEEYSLTK